jgi:hypothetical protein
MLQGMEKRREQSKSKPYHAPRLAVALCLCYYTINLFSDLSQLFSYFKKKGTCTFLVQNKKSTKRNLQAFRLTKARILFLRAIGSPHGFCINKFMQPSAGVGYGTSRRNNRRTRTDI